MANNLISGLDLGSVADYSALATLERLPAPEPTRKRRWQYRLRWLETWDLGTRYTDIVEGVRLRFESDRLRWTRLAADMTGVGVAVVDQLRAAKVQARITPVVITAGHQVTKDPKTGEVHVPKKELVSTLMVLLQAELFKWPAAESLPKTGDAGRFRRLVVKLEKELADFRVKVTKSANETFGADKSQHDDLVLACMLGAWLGENSGTSDPAGITVPTGGDASVVGTAPEGVFITGKEV